MVGIFFWVISGNLQQNFCYKMSNTIPKQNQSGCKLIVYPALFKLKKHKLMTKPLLVGKVQETLTSHVFTFIKCILIAGISRYGKKVTHCKHLHLG